MRWRLPDSFVLLLDEIRKHSHHASAPVDPLDVQYDGIALSSLLRIDENRRRGEYFSEHRFTPAQRAAISAHWSAELRARTASATERQRNQVTYCEEDDL